MAGQEATQPIEMRWSQGMNNLNTSVDLFLRKKGEVVLMVNVDLSRPGILAPLKTLLPLNATAGTDIHSIMLANGTALVVDGTTLQYLLGGVLTTLGSMTDSGFVSWAHVGNWVFMVNGTDKKAVYLPTPALCDWGIAIPTTGPTVAEGEGGNPSGDYACYYRYRVTLPDGTLILTALSPVTNITVASKTIEWSGLTYPTFTGATSVEIDLFRTSVSMAANHLVTTLSSPTDTYSDDTSDADLILLDAYTETGYYPPPDNPSIVKYYPGADRLFCAVANDAYWSEAGRYHIFLYSAAAAEYQSVNSVFLPGEDITAIKRIDENMYFGSTGTWRRLRGKTPSDWTFEDTNASSGPINDRSAVESPWGVIHPGIDGTMWLFTGNTSRSILDEFVFATPPGPDSHASFDGRFYRLFYEDAARPELVVDFLKYPDVPPRIVQSTRSATASFYDKQSGKYYMADAEYVRNGEDPASSIAMTIMTAEIPMSQLLKLGNRSMLIGKLNTLGEALTITPYLDGVASTPITAITAGSERHREPLPFGDAYALSLLMEITTAEPITIEEPWLISKDQG